MRLHSLPAFDMAVFAANLRALQGRTREVTILDDHGLRPSEVEEDLRAGALAHEDLERARAEVADDASA